MQKVVVIGMGYVGFPLACAIARSKKYSVFGYDLDEKKVEGMKKAKVPIEDKQASIDFSEFPFSASTQDSVLENADIIVVCVPTPVTKEKSPDFSHLVSTAKTIRKYLKKGQIIIYESTVNPGVCRERILPILEESGKRAGEDFHLVHCPERIDPGSEKWTVYNIPRNVGGTSLEGTKKAAEFYRSFLDVEVNEMSSLEAAEATKIIENTFRDINIAYVNELAKSFDIMGLDIVEVIKGASNKPFAFIPHWPGCGVGGHCIPVDPYYLIQKGRDIGFEHKFLSMAREINNSMPSYTVHKLMLALNEQGLSVKGTKIALLGLSYKANVGDLRESPSLEIIEELEKLGAVILKHDSHVEGTLPLDEVLSQSKALILATNHKEYASIKNWYTIKVIIDGRNFLDRKSIEEKGILYRGIGRQ